MERVNCNLCKGDNPVFLFTAKDTNQIYKGNFNLVRCKNCGLVYINPRPSKKDILQYYSHQYYGFEDTDIGAYLRRRKAGEYIQKFVKSGKILDIGSGKGLFLSVMKELGFESYGIEFSPIAANFARKTYEVNVFNGELEEAKFPSEYFDIVTMWQVLEHLSYPLESLQEIFRIMKKNGLLIIAVPNFSSIQSRIFRDKWYPLDLPRHLYQFEPKTLRKMFLKTGFKIVKINYFNHFINFVSFKKSILNVLLFKGNKGEKEEFFLRRVGVVNIKKKNSTQKLLKILLDGISFFFSELENLLGYGGTITVYVRKRSF